MVPRFQIGNTYPAVNRWRCAQSQQELVLLRLDAMCFRRRVAEMEKSPDLPSELGWIAILFEGKVLARFNGLPDPRQP
jgi:hypothetical protein